MVKHTKDAVRTQERFVTLPPFNNKEPLTVVQIDGTGKLGVVDATSFRVWVEYDLQSTHVPGWRTLPRASVPAVPAHYGVINKSWIGGMSRTYRHLGCLRAKPKSPSPVVLFAIKLPDTEEARSALSALSDVATVGDLETVEDPEYGTVAELIVHNSIDVEVVAARVARVGALVIFEDASLSALQGIGVERLDRIDAKVCHKDSEDYREEPEEFGIGRGGENWLFPWLPPSWSQPPITWDYMVENIRDVDDVSTIPLPLRQHVAKARYDACGDKGSAYARSLREHLFTKTGEPRRRAVSAGLSKAQSVQVINAFYLLTVERHADAHVKRVASLVLYHYMLRQGYTGRWIGKYQQKALFIGNGTVVRQFKRLSQYAPHRLPATVLNKLVTSDGVIKGRGNKGSRSKYVAREKRYVPKQRVSKEARILQREQLSNVA